MLKINFLENPRDSSFTPVCPAVFQMLRQLVPVTWRRYAASLKGGVRIQPSAKSLVATREEEEDWTGLNDVLKGENSEQNHCRQLTREKYFLCGKIQYQKVLRSEKEI